VTEPHVKTLRSRAETRSLGAAIARALLPGDLVILSGDLGAGKTFLVASMARAMGSRDRVTSPTFSLVHEYRVARPENARLLVHADLYRLRQGAHDARVATGQAEFAREVARLGLYDRRVEGAIVVVEWGGDAVALLGGSASLEVSLAIAGPTERAARLSGLRAGDIV
jgi:tRNA threonylcarbamoyladenosine biosynthesis protein TsaE